MRAWPAGQGEASLRCVDPRGPVLGERRTGLSGDFDNAELPFSDVDGMPTLFHEFEIAGERTIELVVGYAVVDDDDAAGRILGTTCSSDRTTGRFRSTSIRQKLMFCKGPKSKELASASIERTRSIWLLAIVRSNQRFR